MPTGLIVHQEIPNMLPFDGLQRSQISNTFLDGLVGDNWWFSIGQNVPYKTSDFKLVGPHGGSVSKIELHVQQVLKSGMNLICTMGLNFQS